MGTKTGKPKRLPAPDRSLRPRNRPLDRRTAANEVIRVLTHADAFLAGEAVTKIMGNAPVRQSIEARSGLVLNAELPMDTWRENRPLRNAVIHQIEMMRPEAFKAVKAQFDAPLAKLKQEVEGLLEITELFDPV